MKKWVVLGFFFLICVSFVNAQDNEEGKKGFDKSKLFFGGNFGLSFGDYTLINISPQVGYRFNKTLAAGMGFNMQYVAIKNYYIQNSKTSQGVAGLNIFGRVYPAQFLLLQAQPEANYVWGKVKYYDGRQPNLTRMDTKIVPSLLLGGGLAMPAGRGAFLATVFYDVLQNAYSPYGRQAIFNFGYNFGF